MKKRNLLLILIILFIPFVAKAETLDHIYEIRPTTKCSITRDATTNVRAMQGVYFYDHYAVYTGYTADEDPTVVTLVDLNTCTILDKNNEKIMGHANDITYNNQDEKFYVTTGLSDKLVYGFKIVNERIVHDDITITNGVRSSAFDYDSNLNKYYSYLDGKLYTFDSLSSNSQATELGLAPIYYDNFENGQTMLVTQGISSDDKNIYFARTISNSESANYNDSYVLVFNKKTGAYKYSLHFPKSVFEGHLEGVTVIGNTMYFGVNVHTTPANQSFLFIDNLNEYEQQYNSIVKNKEFVYDEDISVYENEEFPFDKIKIKITYIDDTKQVIDLNSNNCTISGFDNKKIGEQTITITYDGQQISLKINIMKKENKDEVVNVPNTLMHSPFLLTIIGLLLIGIGTIIIIKIKKKKSIIQDSI